MKGVAKEFNKPYNPSNDSVADIDNGIQMLDISNSESVNGRAHGRRQREVKSFKLKILFLFRIRELNTIFGSFALQIKLVSSANR